MEFERSVDEAGVTLTFPETKGMLRRLVGAGKEDLASLSAKDRALAFAIADLRALGEGSTDELEITDRRIRMSHRLVASLDAKTGRHLGLPPLTDLTLRTDVEGLIGAKGFRLKTEWWRGGVRKVPRRIGAILKTDQGEQRLPLWMLEALEVAETPDLEGDAAQWEALARFRRALDPGVSEGGDAAAARISMTDFLSGLQVSLADGFSISPNAAGDDFEVLPFSRERLEGEISPSEGMSELAGRDLGDFQRKLRERGALHAFRLGPGRFMVVDRSAAPALEVMAQMQRAPQDERAEFTQNPRRRISEAIEAAMERAGSLVDLDDAAREEAIERAAGPVLVETTEYEQFSARVIGIGAPDAPAAGIGGVGPTTWLPEIFSAEVRQRIEVMPRDDLAHLAGALEQAIEAGETSVSESGVHLPAQKDVLEAIRREIERRDAIPEAPDEEPEAGPDEKDATGCDGPAVLVTQNNYDDVHWRPEVVARGQGVEASTSAAIRTEMKPHQNDSLRWQVEAWASGLPCRRPPCRSTCRWRSIRATVTRVSTACCTA